ncbi:MAG: protein kinase [Planctomycetaceae bacterium]|nr:protein kinase [Planctomycetaceae bacterium]
MFEKLFGRNKTGHEHTDITRRFELNARVGQGSMSKVWKATDRMSGRFVAVKVLDKEKTARFEARFPGLNKPTEGDIAVSLHHPHIVETTEFGWTPEDEMFLVMAYVEGVGLSLLVDLQNEEMRRYRLRYMIQIGEALHYFHQQNWIHRDICPRNLMVSENKQVKMIDFGLAVPNTPPFRKPGNRTGTAAYMAPELIKRMPTDHRIDIFGYAVTCYEMYTKRFPWDASLTIDAALQHINKPPVQIKELIPAIDDQIAATIMKGLESNPDDRWQSAAEMVTQFREAEARLVKAARAAAAARATGTQPPSGRTAAPVAPSKSPAPAPSPSTGKPSASASGAAKAKSPAAGPPTGKRSRPAPPDPSSAAAADDN